MLDRLQNHLVDLNQADPGHNVLDFLITDPQLARVLGQESLVADTLEAVLVSQDEEGLAVSVFIDRDVLSRLEASDPIEQLDPGQLDDLWKVIEGISHFNYIAWCAGQNKSTTLLELEIQAEVDKFASTSCLALAQQDRSLADRIHGWLFGDVSFNPHLNRDQHERYRAANDIAARFCHGLGDRLWHNSESAVSEVRHFYRLSQAEKISHIHAQSWHVQ